MVIKKIKNKLFKNSIIFNKFFYEKSLIIFLVFFINYFFFFAYNAKLIDLTLIFFNLSFFCFLILSLFFLIFILLSVAFFTLLERKKLSTFQNRKGPNKVGYLGILQPISDAGKLLLKEIILPRNSNFIIFILSPVFAFFFGLVSWVVIPFSYNFVISNINLSVLFIFCISIFHIYGIIFAGWASNSRYSFLGALRSSAQLIAYDISIGVIVINIILFTKSLNLIDIIEFQDYNGNFFLLLFLFLLFLICILAETNRHPFDLPEAESELVSGYNVEYSALSFALFFLAEYSSIILISIFTVILFLGGFVYNFFFFFKVLFFLFFFLVIRAAIPRYRYDQLMRIGWKLILPLALSMFFFNFFFIVVLL